MSLPNEENGSNVIEISSLTRQFGPKTAIEDISLSIARGGVFGLIGGNGAGKTTLLKHILGLYIPQKGCVEVFGLDPARHPVEVMRRIGYMAEDRELPNWIRIGDLLRYTQAFYPTWDAKYAEELREMFDLDSRSRARELSRGQRARVCLLLALAHRPELLVLDEPSSGLDPVVRRDILGAVIRTVADEGRTVIFSSHLLDEVERVADQIAIIHHGRIILCSSMEQIKDSYRRLTLRFEGPVVRPPELLGTLSIEGKQSEWTYVCHGEQEKLHYAAKSVGATVVEERSLTLDDLFVATVRQQASKAQ